MRELTNTVYKTYAIESDSQVSLYAKLAVFTLDNPGCLIESLAPGFYVEEEESVYTLLVTVAQ